ncbi:MAG: PAS domain S-box protein [Chloroflexi bacterium]|nr:PAS domain S-box protein [Chloroflexota bacterium]
MANTSNSDGLIEVPPDKTQQSSAQSGKPEIDKEESSLAYSILQGVIESSHNSIFSLDLNYQYTSFNKIHAKSMEHLYGVKIQIGYNFLDYITADEARHLTRQNINRALKGEPVIEESFSEDREFPHQYFRVSYNPIRESGGRIIGVTVTSSDLTKHRQTEENLRQSEERLRLAITSAKQGMFDLNLKTGEAIVNSDYHTMLGYNTLAPYETLSKWVERLHPDDLERAMAVFNGCAKGAINEYRVEYRQRTREGQWKWLLSIGRVVAVDSDGQPLRMLGTHTDITPLKQAEERIQRLSNLYVALSQTNQAIVRIRDRQTLYQEICRIGVEYGGLLMAWIGLNQSNGEFLTTAASFGLKQEYLNSVVISTNPDVPEGRGPTGTAFWEKRHYICNDFFNDPITLPWRRPAELNGFRASAAFPLTEVGQVVGVLTLYSAEVGYFDEEIVKLLDEMAIDISFALDNFIFEEQRIKALKDLGESEERYRFLAENVNDLIFRDTLDGKVLYISPVCRTVLGYEPEEMVGRHIIEFFHPDDLKSFQESYNGPLTDNSSTLFVTRVRHKDGHYIWLESNVRTVLDPVTTKPQYSIGISRDITERKNAEEALKRTQDELLKNKEQLFHAQKMETVGRLAGGVAHDFNNLLTVMQSYAELGYTELSNIEQSEERGEKYELLRQSLIEIKKATQKSAALTGQLLAISRRQLMQPRVVDLNVTVAEIERMLRRLIGEDIELVSDLDPHLGKVMADPGQIEQVILNLAINARDAMVGVGTLKLKTTNVELDEEYSREHLEVKPGSYVVMEISDTGCGMDKETMSHIFEPFFTTKEPGKGTGLGLSTVYGIVQQSQGHIWVYSEPGIGTVFKIILPRLNGEATRAVEKQQGISNLASGSETILLIEDEPSIRKLISLVLRKHGYTVLEAGNGFEGLEICRTYKEAIHLLASDMVMPRMGGHELAEQVEKYFPNLKMLFMSGYSSEFIYSGLIKSDAAFIQKPFSATDFVRKVRAVLDQA